MWQLPPSHSRLLSRDYSLPKSWGSLRVTALTSAATEPWGKIKMLRFHRFSLQGISIPSGLSQCLGMPGKSAARVSPSPAMRPQRKAESDGFCSKRFANLQLSLITLMAFLASLGSGFMGTRSQPSWASRSSGCKLFLGKDQAAPGFILCSQEKLRVESEQGWIYFVHQFHLQSSLVTPQPKLRLNQAF